MGTIAQVGRALVIVWFLLSSISALVVLAPFFVREEFLYNVMPECSSWVQYGVPCPLCGLTRSFVLISSGRFSEARRLSPYALFVYFGFVGNALSCLAVVVRDVAFNHGGKLGKILTMK